MLFFSFSVEGNERKNQETLQKKIIQIVVTLVLLQLDLGIFNCRDTTCIPELTRDKVRACARWYGNVL